MKEQVEKDCLYKYVCIRCISHSISMIFKHVVKINISSNFFSHACVINNYCSVFEIFAKEDCCYLLGRIFVSVAVVMCQ